MNDVIYKSSNCPGCIVVENALRANPLPVRMLNIDTDPMARQYFQMTGSKAVPTAVIDGRVSIGAPAILAALRAKYGRV